MNHQKSLFNFPTDLCYLNMASQSPSFKVVEKAGIDAVKKKSTPHQITISDYFEPVDQLKKLVAKLIDVADHNRIATLPSVSYGIATVANNICLEEGDEIVLIDKQFPSNYYAWEKLAQKYKATIKFVEQPILKTGRGKQWNKDLLDAITDRTAVVAIGTIHWSNGTLFELKAIRNKTREKGALFILDGSQSVGALPFSVKEIDPDALIFAGYKWLFGPYGCAYGYFGPYFDNGNPLEENWSNRLHSEDFTKLTTYESNYKPLANRYCVGQSGSFIYVQMQLAALQQVIDLQPDKIQNYCHSITEEAAITLRNAGCFVEESEYRAKHLFGIELPKNSNITQLKKDLEAEQIHISFRGNYIRLSTHVFNTKDEIDKLVNCILAAI